MTSADDIKKYFRKSTLSTNPDRHEAVFEEILRAHEQSEKTEPASNRLILRINIMKNPIAKLAVAAVIIIACLTGLTMFDRTSSIALANVLTQIEQISAYIYQMDMTSSGSRGVSDTSIETRSKIQGTILFSQEYGAKTTLDILNLDSEETTSLEQYLLLKNKSLISIIHNQKSYTRMEFDDTYFERMKTESYDPRKMVEQILECEYKSLGRSTIDGIEVEGFQTTDPKYQGGVYNQVDIKLWVDVKTQLPVQIEMDCRIEGPMSISISMNGVIHNFQWNVPVNAAEFEPIIPDDYTTALGDSIKLPAFNEETAVKGLKLHADLIGNYPEELNPVTLPSQIFKIMKSGTPAAKRLQEETKGFNQEEKTQKLIETIMPIQGAGMFYMLLVQENKDPAYYGDIITPEDADQVLMRWKVSENTYRVIFGDLHAETVDADVLAELEATLPK